jgi:GxxExxY protein
MNRIEKGIQDTLTEQVIGAAMAVHRALGPGFLESVYRNALAFELRAMGLEVKTEVAIPVFYRGEQVGDFFADLVVQGLVIELKATRELHPAHEAQLVNYLQATKTEVGLLLNFGTPSLGIKRKYRKYSKGSSSPHLENPANPDNPVKVSLRFRSAFTLLELLVAMAVLAILVVMMMGLVSSATALWRQSENRAEAYREARAAMTIMARDLQNTIASTNTNLFRVNAGAFSHLGGSDIITDPSNASAIFFHAAMPKSAQDSTASKSDVCQVGYFIAFDRTAMSSNSPGFQKTMNLYRYFLSSDPTFANLTNAPHGNPFAMDIIPTAAEVELLARNVREFRIIPLIFTNNTLTNSFSPSTNKPLPDIVEIHVTAVNQETARRFTQKSDWTSPTAAITNQQQTFTTRIRLNQPVP